PKNYPSFLFCGERDENLRLRFVCSIALLRYPIIPYPLSTNLPLFCHDFMHKNRYHLRLSLAEQWSIS
ncbi:hypothetical protein, partial [Pantoea eucalypti]|uniref:hypothetical protein n=1 Tax=Pantoea eucalypti TaxID=470933 RepID=UPI00289EEE38